MIVINRVSRPISGHSECGVPVLLAARISLAESTRVSQMQTHDVHDLTQPRAVAFGRGQAVTSSS